MPWTEHCWEGPRLTDCISGNSLKSSLQLVLAASGLSSQGSFPGLGGGFCVDPECNVRLKIILVMMVIIVPL